MQDVYLRTGGSTRSVTAPRADPGGNQVPAHCKRLFFTIKKHQTVEIIKLNGSIELAPIVGLSEVICDIVETGSTLRENGLTVLEEVCPLSARMVVNQVSMKMEMSGSQKLISDLKNVINTERNADPMRNFKTDKRNTE